MSNWTVATLYRRFQEVIGEEMGLDYSEVDHERLTLAQIDEAFRSRIVEEAIGSTPRTVLAKPRDEKKPAEK